MYRTGDAGRWLAHGEIEHRGRIDLQVKIRGFRIELEEIANQLEQHPTVEQALVGRAQSADAITAAADQLDAALDPEAASRTARRARAGGTRGGAGREIQLHGPAQRRSALLDRASSRPAHVNEDAGVMGTG